MSGAGRAAVIGAVVAVGVGIVIAVALVFGLVETPFGGVEPDRVLVVAAAPDESGSDLAALAFVVETASGQVTLLDVQEKATVSGTSATTAAEALPFGGGDAVAEALTPQTGGRRLQWIVVPAQEWAGLIDSVGGVEVDVPAGLSAYTRGRLTILQQGPQQVDGDQAVAIASAVKFAGTPDDQKALLRQLTAALSAIAGSHWTELQTLVADGRASSSLDAEEIPGLSAVQ